MQDIAVILAGERRQPEVLQRCIGELKKQSLVPWIAVGESRNEVTRALPSTIKYLIYLDAILVPVDFDWLERTRAALTKFDVVLPFDKIEGEKTFSVFDLFGKSDPALDWSREAYSDCAIALRKSVWEAHGGLPAYRVREYFQFESEKPYRTPHFLGETEHRPLVGKRLKTSFGFVPRRLQCIHLPSEDQKQRVLKAFSRGKENLSIEQLCKKDIYNWAKDYQSKCNQTDLIPISLARAYAHSRNPFAEETDVVLSLGYVGNRLAAYAGFLPGFFQKDQTREKVFFSSSAFIYHDLKPTGLSQRMVEKIKSLQLNLISCEDRPSAREIWNKEYKKFQSLRVFQYEISTRLHRSSILEVKEQGPFHFLRDEKVREWMIQFPWFHPESTEDRRYYFDLPLLDFKYGRGENFLYSLSVSRSNGKRSLKILDLLKDSPMDLLEELHNIALEENADLIETHLSLPNDGFSLVKSWEREYFGAVGGEVDPQYVDGDAAFASVLE